MLERHPAQFRKYKRSWTLRSNIVPALVAGVATILMLDLNVRKPVLGPGMIIDAVLALTAVGLSLYAGYARLMVSLCKKAEKGQALAERKQDRRPEG
jgi:hypothetical protein